MLKGKTALVTGASKGVGRAIAEAYAREGARLVLVARSRDALEEAAGCCRDAGAAGVAVRPCDLTDPAEIDKLGAEVLEQHGCVHVLVNNAGTYPEPGKNVFLEGDPSAGEAALWLNVQAPMRLTRLLAPAMAKEGSGHIVNVGSVAGRKPVADEGSYSASKWAMRGWSAACYESLRRHGIRVTLIEPAHIATDMAQIQEGSRYGEMMPELMIQPEDVAAAALLPLRLSDTAVPAEIVLQKLQTPYKV